MKSGAVAEIGVWRGDFAAVLLEKLEPSALYLIDPWLWIAAACALIAVTYRRLFAPKVQGDKVPGTAEST